MIVAGGGLALGVAGHVLHESRAGDFNDVCTVNSGVPMPAIVGSGADCRGKHDSVEAAERMMWIGYVGAGVFAAAGVTLVLLAPRADRTARARGQPVRADAGGRGGNHRRRLRLELLSVRSSRWRIAVLLSAVGGCTDYG